MLESQAKLSPYRWVVLSVFMLINIVIQMLWICYAPIASQAAGFFGVGHEDIDLLANVFLIVYVPMAFPAAWAIDRLGIHKAVGFGAGLMGFFGLLRGIFPANYPVAMIATIGLAIGQPFILSAMTKIAALWFPLRMRATITGIMFLALFGGVAVGEAVTPEIVKASGIAGMELIYGLIAAAVALLFIIFARSEPKIAVDDAGSKVRALMLDGLKHMLKDKDVYILMLLILLGSSVVNGIFTLIDGFGAEKHFSANQGILLVTLMLAGGIVGSVVLPGLSDGLRRRKLILVAAGLIGGCLTIALTLTIDFTMALILGTLVGFFLTGVVPVAYQYGAEITHPTPEGTSNGILGLVLQAAGFLILAMDGLKPIFHNSYAPSLVGLGVLVLLSAILLFFVRESPEIRKSSV